MSRNTVHVEELRAKIAFLAVDPVARLIGEHNSEAELLNSIRENARNTVRSGYLRNKINADIEAALAQKCQFDNLHAAWRLHSKIEFERYYYGCHRDLAPPDTPTVPLLEAPLVLLKEDLSASINSTHSAYASLALRTGQTDSAPGEVRLGFDLNCPEDKNDGLITGVKRCILLFDCGGGRTTNVADRTGYPDGAVFDRARLTPLSVSPQIPSWIVESVDGNVVGLVGAIPHTFIQIDRLTPNDTIEASIRVCVKNMQTTFVLPEGPQQSAAKRRIKERLVQLTTEEGEDGQAVLATTQMKLAARK